MQHAADAARAGSTVNARCGVYEELVSVNASGNASEGYITFRSYPGETAILEAEHFTPAGKAASPLFKTGSRESLVVNGNVTNFRITHNIVHDNNNIGIDVIGFERTATDSVFLRYSPTAGASPEDRFGVAAALSGVALRD